MSHSEALPHVQILLATHNGISWIDEQLKSLLNQTQVQVSILVSDDASTDGTYEWLLQAAQIHQQLTILPRTIAHGSAGKNFYYLLNRADFDAADYIAFSDQDDIWDADKLCRHIEIARQVCAEAVSSSVLAFWPDGREILLNKSQPQRDYDYLFESAGPGCTFLMSIRLAHQVRSVLQDAQSPARDVTLHDWLCYAVARSLGYTWVIDPQSSLQYRQHGNNVIGANVSIKAKWARLKKIRDKWYRQQVINVARIAYANSLRKDIQRLLVLLEQPSMIERLQLLSYAWNGRRSAKDRFFLMIAIVFKWF